MTTANSLEHDAGDVSGSGGVLNRSQVDRHLGHAVYHTARVILRNGHRAGLTHVEQACGTVFAHTGQQYAHGSFPGVSRDRIEEDIGTEAHWLLRVEEFGAAANADYLRLPLWIDRRDMTKTRQGLFRLAEERTAPPPPSAWTTIRPPDSPQ